jgi:hypothetical protein
MSDVRWVKRRGAASIFMRRVDSSREVRAMPVMLRFILAACFFAVTAAHAQQIILLKLDDVIARRVGTKPLSDR